jgi:hypothetical protein
LPTVSCLVYFAVFGIHSGRFNRSKVNAVNISQPINRDKHSTHQHSTGIKPNTGNTFEQFSSDGNEEARATISSNKNGVQALSGLDLRFESNNNN